MVMKDVLINEDESIDDLQNGYHIIQKKNAFRYGVDAVLLADFVKTKKNDKVLEIGTGTGIIPILIAAKANKREMPASIEAVEVQSQMAEMADRSVELNSLQDLIKIRNIDIRNFDSNLKKAEYDIVVMNPPYMRAEKGINCPDESRNIACFEIKGTLEELIESAKDLLKTGGKLFMIHRADRLADVFFAMRTAGIEPKKIRFVQSKPRSKPHLILIMGSRNGGVELKFDDPLIIYEEDGTYTKDVLEIYGREQENK